MLWPSGWKPLWTWQRVRERVRLGDFDIGKDGSLVPDINMAMKDVKCCLQNVKHACVAQKTWLDLASFIKASVSTIFATVRAL